MNEENKGNIIIYQSEDGTSKINVRIENETVWLTQKQMSELFEVSVSAINQHIKNIFGAKELNEETVIKFFLITANDGKTYNTAFYNLDMIISVGYRVNSISAVRFRQWATQILKEYIIKGFALDDERLKKDKNTPIEELVKRVRDIRASELNFYQKIRDVLKLSSDYRANDDETKIFFAKIQNKLLFAIVGKTAAEIIYERANHEKTNMGLTNFKGSIVRVEDIYISKNYLNEKEITKLNALTNMFLYYIEDQVERTQKQLFMDDWENKTDKFLQFNEYNLLNGLGKISGDEAKSKAKTEYGIFDKDRKEKQKVEAEKEDLREIEKLNKKLKKLK